MLLLVVLGVGMWWFIRHQRVLKERAFLMREAIRNRDFTFRLPARGPFFGERALQEALNDLGQDIGRMVAHNEVEAWQRLTRVLTHEIMNATAPICSISQAYLARPDIQGTAYEEGLRAIHNTGSSLAAFVESYRKLTQLSEPTLTAVRLYELLQSVKTLYPDVDWRIHIPAFLTLQADAGLLRQILVNLVKNAVEAGAHIVDVRWRDALLVSNDGSPILPDIRRDIFVPFFTTKPSGSGVGLSLSRQLAMMQGMELKLADTAVAGYHATFVLETGIYR